MSIKSYHKLPLIVCLGSLFLASCNLNDNVATNNTSQPPRATSITNSNTKSFYEPLAFTKTQVVSRGSSFNNFEYTTSQLSFSDSLAHTNVDRYYQQANQANNQNFLDTLSYNSSELMNITYQQNRNTLFILGLGLPLLGKGILQTQENHDGAFINSAQRLDLGPNNFTGKGVKVNIIDGILERNHPDFAKTPIQIPYAAENTNARPLGEDANHGTYVGLIIGGKRGQNLPGLVPDVDFSYLSMHNGDRDLVKIYDKVNQGQPDVINNSYHIPYVKPENVATGKSYEPTIINSLNSNDETIYRNTYQALENISTKDAHPPLFVYATGNYNFKDYLRKIVDVESRKKLFNNNFGFETGKDTTLKNLFDSKVISENLIGVTGLFLDLHGTLRATIDLTKNNVINGFTAENESDVIARRNAGKSQPVVQFNKDMIISYPGAIQCGVIKYNCIAGSYIYEYANQWQSPTVENSIIKGGTSFSTPEISAIIAMVKEQFPWMTNRNLKETVYSSSMDIGEPGIDNVFGWGAVNATIALNGPTMFAYGDFIADMSKADHRPFSLREQLDFNIDAYKPLPLAFERFNAEEGNNTSAGSGTSTSSEVTNTSSSGNNSTSGNASSTSKNAGTTTGNANSTAGNDSSENDTNANAQSNTAVDNATTQQADKGTQESSSNDDSSSTANNQDKSSQNQDGDNTSSTVPVSVDDEQQNNITTPAKTPETPNGSQSYTISNFVENNYKSDIELAAGELVLAGNNNSSSLHTNLVSKASATVSLTSQEQVQSSAQTTATHSISSSSNAIKSSTTNAQGHLTSVNEQEQLKQLLNECIIREEKNANLRSSLNDIGSEAMASQAQGKDNHTNNPDPCDKYRNLIVDVVESIPLVSIPQVEVDPFATKQHRKAQWTNVVAIQAPNGDNQATTIINSELKDEIDKAKTLLKDNNQSKLGLIGNKSLPYVNIDDPNTIGFNYFFNNNIVGNGGLIVNGNNKDFLYLTGNNSFTGNTIVESGNLALVAPQTIGVRANHQHAVSNSPVYVQNLGSYYQHNASSASITNNGYTLLSNAIVKGDFRNNPNATLALDVTETSQIQGRAYLDGTLYLYNAKNYISTKDAKDQSNGTLLLTATGGFIGKFDKVFLDNIEIVDYEIYSNGTNLAINITSDKNRK